MHKIYPRGRNVKKQSVRISDLLGIARWDDPLGSFEHCEVGRWFEIDSYNCMGNTLMELNVMAN